MSFRAASFRPGASRLICRVCRHFVRTAEEFHCDDGPVCPCASVQTWGVFDTVKLLQSCCIQVVCEQVFSL